MAGKLITARELEKNHGIRRYSAYRMAKAGIIPSIRVGLKRRGVRFDPKMVIEALAQR